MIPDTRTVFNILKRYYPDTTRGLAINTTNSLDSFLTGGFLYLIRSFMGMDLHQPLFMIGSLSAVLSIYQFLTLPKPNRIL
jgi:hypothetical protein